MGAIVWSYRSFAAAIGWTRPGDRRATPTIAVGNLRRVDVYASRLGTDATAHHVSSRNSGSGTSAGNFFEDRLSLTAAVVAFVVERGVDRWNARMTEIPSLPLFEYD